MSSQDMEGTSKQGQQQPTTLDYLVTKQFQNTNVDVYGTYWDPLFNAKQVCKILGIKQSRKAIQDYKENEKISQPSKSLTGLKSQWFLTELGILKLMMKQDNELAQQFQDWVFGLLKEFRLNHYQSLQSVQQSDDNQKDQQVDSITKQFNELEISIYGTKEEPLFDPKQIGKILEIKDVNQSIKNFNQQQKVKSAKQTPGGIQQVYMLKEFGLYELIFQSRKPQAQQFKFWVFNVIREIRLTGQYRLQDSNKQLQIENKKYQEENQKYQEELKKFQSGNNQFLQNHVPEVQKRTFEQEEYNDKLSIYKYKDEGKDIYYVGEQDSMEDLEEAYTKNCIDGQLCEDVLTSVLKHQDLFCGRWNCVMCSLDHIRLMIDQVCNQINVLMQCREDIEEEELIRRLKNEFGQSVESVTEEENVVDQEQQTDQENVVDQEEETEEEKVEDDSSKEQEETDNSDEEKKDQEETEKWEKVSVSNKEEEASTSKDVRTNESTLKEIYKWIPQKVQYKKGIAIYCDDLKQVFQEETKNEMGKATFRKILQEFFGRYTKEIYVGQLRLRVNGERLQKNALHNVRFIDDKLNKYNYPYNFMNKE